MAASFGLIDTHAHIHHQGLVEQAGAVVKRAREVGVSQLVTVGCDMADSQLAVEHAERYEGVWATIGIHPLEGRNEELPTDIAGLKLLAAHPKVVAVGECGLDYSRGDEPATRQAQAVKFRAQIELALEHDLPMVWHVRDAFPDFFAITAEYPDLRGIVHCFTSTLADMHEAVSRGYYIALNGIMTFTKLDWQLDMARTVPLNHLVLETDCPFLSPVPQRNHTNEPAFLAHTAEFLANLRGETVEEFTSATSDNAIQLLSLK